MAYVAFAPIAEGGGSALWPAVLDHLVKWTLINSSGWADPVVSMI